MSETYKKIGKISKKSDAGENGGKYEIHPKPPRLSVERQKRGLESLPEKFYDFSVQTFRHVVSIYDIKSETTVDINKEYGSVSTAPSFGSRRTVVLTGTALAGTALAGTTALAGVAAFSFFLAGRLRRRAFPA